ncbi:MAG: Gfo/Idh/MocA family oxidoreductase [Chloroflexi bacterium]|nr:Gfo/Idh/MocA family oxidoreductase [Chloroflexota bacterium]
MGWVTGEQTTFRAAVIGLGFIGAGDPVSGEAIGQQVGNLDGTHAQALADHPQVRLVAGASRDEGRRARFEERHKGAATYADWRDMLGAERPEIVSVATNSPVHAEITVACAEAGVRAVYCEKPLATCLSDADRAIEACRKHGTILAVNHNRRWHPLWRVARDAIRTGAIGDPYHAVVHWPTGRLGNVGTHMFDALRMLLGAEACAVSGSLDPVLSPDCRGAQYRDPGGWGIVAFAAGVRAFVDAPQAAKLPLVVRIVGSLGQLSVSSGGARIEPVAGEAWTLTPPMDGSSSMDRAVRDIVTCLTEGGEPAGSGEDGRAALEIIVGFHVSDRQHGRWVPLPIAAADRDFAIAIG